MERKNLIERVQRTDRGVSPVIGVILMVAITVILAAVIGTFVLDLGQSAGNSAPSASLTVTTDAGDGNVNVSHKGGDSLQSGNTRVLISNGSDSVTFSENNSDTFGVGEEVGFHINGTSDPSTTWELDAPDNDLEFGSGDRLEVQFIDTESQRVIFETTVTA